MFRTILTPLDGSAVAEHALPLAGAVARRAGAALRLALVHHRHPGGPAADIVAAQTEGAYLDAVVARVREQGRLPVTADLIEEGAVAPALCGHARTVGADLIVLTTHGRGPVSRFWLGSVTDELLRQSPVPLLVRRPAEGRPVDLTADVPIRRILLPLDGSEESAAVLGPAAEIGRLTGAAVTLLRAVEPVPAVTPAGQVMSWSSLDFALAEELTLQARGYLDRTAARLRDQGLRVAERIVVYEPAAPAVLAAAEHADLVALATHGPGRVARFFFGSVADKVVRGAPCPVLVVPKIHAPT